LRILTFNFINLSGVAVHKAVIPGVVATTSGTVAITDNVIVFDPEIANGGSGTIVVPISCATAGDVLTLPFALMHKNDDGSVVECCSDEVVIELPPCEQWFIRCDTNRDGACDIADAISLLGYLFLGLTCSCLDACDCNDDGSVDIGDAIYKLALLFGGGPLPPSPYPECGPDPTADGLGCAQFDFCPCD
jgi:hypothetical protein